MSKKTGGALAKQKALAAEAGYDVLVIDHSPQLDAVEALEMLTETFQGQSISAIVLAYPSDRPHLAALEEATTCAYDAILMDCQMPKMDGLTATKEIRRLEAPARDVPIAAVTANAMEGDRKSCTEAGMNDYISKPIRKRPLEDLLGRLLPTKQSEV